jgi:hypothetical protein
MSSARIYGRVTHEDSLLVSFNCRIPTLKPSNLHISSTDATDNRNEPILTSPKISSCSNRAYCRKYLDTSSHTQRVYLFKGFKAISRQGVKCIQAPLWPPKNNLTQSFRLGTPKRKSPTSNRSHFNDLSSRHSIRLAHAAHQRVAILSLREQEGE